ncbi:MAG: hypothetical protein ACC645_17150, partial [Pirellulales bacterium]
MFRRFFDRLTKGRRGRNQRRKERREAFRSEIGRQLRHEPLEQRMLLTAVPGATSGSDTVLIEVTGADSATVTVNATVTNITGAEKLTYNGLGGNDSVTVLGTTDDDTIVFTPYQLDAGLFEFVDEDGEQLLLPFYFQNVGLDGDLTVDGRDDSDRLVYNGTDLNDEFVVSGDDIDLSTPVGDHIPLQTDSVGQLVLNGFNGDDRFEVRDNTPFVYLGVHGGNPSASDVLRLVTNSTAASVTIVPSTTDPEVTKVTGLGPAIDATGVEDIYFDGSGNDDDLLVDLGSGNATARVQNAPLIATDEVLSNRLPRVLFTDVNNFTLEGGAEPSTVTFQLNDLEGSNTWMFDSDGPGDTLIVEGTALNDDIRLSRVVSDLQIDGEDTLIVRDMKVSDLLVLNLLGGDDVVTVDVDGSSLIKVPVTVQGGVGVDHLVVTGAPTTTVDEVVYDVGPIVDRGHLTYQSASDATLMEIFFEGLEPVHDYIPANLTVNGNHADNAINYVGGPNSNTVGPLNPGGVETGLVSVDAFETIEFGNKSDITIDGRAGNDTVNVADPTNPGASGSLTVVGNDAVTSDEVTLSGTPASDTVLIEITGSHSAIVTINGAVTNVNTTQKFVYNGLGGDDDVTIEGIAGGDNRFLFAPGPARDSARITGFDETANVSFLPIDLLELGSGGVLEFDGNSGFGNNTLVVQGTSSRDVVDVEATTGNVTVTTAAGPSVELQNDQINHLVIDTLEGDDVIELGAPVSAFDSVTVNGGDPGSGSDRFVLDLLSGTFRVKLEPDDGTPDPDDQLVRIGGTTVATLSGIEGITVTGDGDDDLTVESGNGNVEARIQGGVSPSYDLVTSNGLPDIEFTGIDAFEFDESGNGVVNVTFVTADLAGADDYLVNMDESDTLTIEGADGRDDAYTVISPAPGDVTVTDNVSGAAVSGDPAALILKTLGGDDTVTVDLGSIDVIPVAITFDGGAGSDSLTVSGSPDPGVDEVIYSPGPGLTEGRLRYEGPADTT